MKLKCLPIILFITSIIISTAFSDIIQFKNGDKITGEITEINSTTISINFEILGSVSVPLDKVDRIITENQYKITTLDGIERIGKLDYKNNELSITQKKKSSKIDIANLKKIEPITEVNEPSKKEKRTWSGEIKALASFQRGTVDTSHFEGNTKFDIQTKNGKLSTEAWANYGEVEEDINIRKYGGNLRYSHYPKEKLYIYGETIAERDESRKLALRGQIGAGAGFDLLKKEKQILSFESGLLYTYEEYLPFIPYEKNKEKENRIKEGINRISSSVIQISQNPNHITSYGGLISGIAILLDPLQGYKKTNDDFISLRICTNFSSKILSSSTLTNKLSLETNLERIEYYIFGSNTTLSTPLHDNLSLELSLSNEYDSDYKNRGVDAWEHRLSTGLKYEF